MTNTTKGLTTLCICLFTVLALFTGCEDPGSIGEEYIDKSELTFDTLSVKAIQNQNYTGYSGRLAHIATGNYSDDIFGDITALALLKPSLSLPAGKKLTDDHDLKLKLLINNVLTYGDTLKHANYSIYEITSYWNGVNFKIDDDFEFDESSKIGEFIIGEVDSLVVDLADSWKQTYSQLLNSSGDTDSLLQYEFKGLALVADENTDKIIHLNIGDTELYAISPEDTIAVGMRDWAFKLERTNEIHPAVVSPLHSTIENVLYFSLEDYMAQIQGKNFIKAELIFYEVADEMNNALSINEIRPVVGTLSIDRGLGSDPAYEMQFGSVEELGSKRTSDNSFRFNLTNYFNSYLFGNQEQVDMYLSIGSSEGVLRSTLIYNSLADETLQPKLVLTFLEGGTE